MKHSVIFILIIESELKMLKDEFAHHQEKVLQYYSLLEEHNSRKLREESIINCVPYCKPLSIIMWLTLDAFVNEAFMENLQDLEDKAETTVENLAVEGVR